MSSDYVPLSEPERAEHARTPSLIFSSWREAWSAGYRVEYVGRPLDLSRGEYVSCHGFDPPVFLGLPDQDGCVYGCGDSHPDAGDGDGPCGIGMCHGRPGDDRPQGNNSSDADQ